MQNHSLRRFEVSQIRSTQMLGDLTPELLANEKLMLRKLTSHLRRLRVQTGAKRPKAKRSDANLDLEEVLKPE